MEVKKMNENIDEMEKIVMKMNTIKDAYELLEDNFEKTKVLTENIYNLEKELTELLNENKNIIKANQKLSLEFNEKYEVIDRNVEAKLGDFIQSVNNLIKDENEEFNSKFDKELSNLKSEILALIEVNKKDNLFYRSELLKTQNTIKKLSIFNAIFLFIIIILECYFNI